MLNEHLNISKTKFRTLAAVGSFQRGRGRRNSGTGVKNICLGSWTADWTALRTQWCSTGRARAVFSLQRFRSCTSVADVSRDRGGQQHLLHVVAEQKPEVS